jgi:hypothetical protein
MCRGDRRESAFSDKEGQERLPAALSQARERTGWLSHAPMLTRNYDHLLLGTSKANQVAGMRCFQGTRTTRFDLRHRLRGHLFQVRYEALLVDPAEEGYFLQASTRIHANAARAMLLKGDRRAWAYQTAPCAP